MVITHTFKEVIFMQDLAKQIYKNSLVADIAIGFEPEVNMPIKQKWETLNTFISSGHQFLSLAVATDATTLEQTILYLAKIHAYIEIHANKFLLVKTVEDILKTKAENKLGLGLMFQGINPVNNDLAMFDIYYQLGLRSMILTYNVRNGIGDGVAEKTDIGLSQFGFQVIQKMNQVGMLIDLSHTGYKTTMEAMEASKQPVIFSHSNAYEVFAHVRNLKDDQLQLLAKTGGVVGVNGIGALLGDQKATPQKYFEHIDYIAQKIGTEHIAIGSDLIYFPDFIDEFLQSNTKMYPETYIKQLSENNQWSSLQPQQLIEVVEIMLQHHYPEEKIKGILGENYLRVAQQVWK